MSIPPIPPSPTSASSVSPATDAQTASNAREARPADEARFELDAWETMPYFALAKGTILGGRYKILEKLGEGGMGVVFLADQLDPVSRRVAIKLIKQGVDSVPVLARFEQERQLLALMEHDHIAKIFDGGVTEQGFPYIVLELVKGVPITKFCDAHQLPLRQRLELFLQACDAVHHAHQKGIIHRDLKPSNLLITEQSGRAMVKVIDFGVAKALQQRVTDFTIFTERGSLVGTLEYMAPEQAGTNQLDIDTRADVYSLGAVLYELLTGSPPFSRKELRETSLDRAIHLIREVEPLRPSTKITRTDDPAALAVARGISVGKLSKDIAHELDWVIMQCLEKERNRRYGGVGDLAADLGRFLRQEPVSAHPPSRRYRLKKFIQRHRTAVVATVLVAVALMSALTLTLLAWNQARQAEALAREENSIHVALQGFINSDLFSAIDADQRAALGLALDQDVKVKTLLDRASNNIAQGRFAQLPLVEAALRLTIGKAYLALGMLDMAHSHLDKSAQLRETKLGRAQDHTLESKEALAEACIPMGKYDRAQELLEEVQEARVRSLGLAAQATQNVLYNRCLLEFSQKRYTSAEAKLKELLAILAPDKPNRLHEYYLANNLLATVYQLQDKSADAERLYRELIQEARHDSNAIAPTYILILNNFAQALRKQGKNDQALELYRDILPVAIQAYGKDHIITAVYQNNYASLCIRLGQLDPAEPVLRDCIRALALQLSPDHRKLLLVKNNLAYLLLLKRQPKKSFELYREIRVPFVKQYGIRDPLTDALTRDMLTASVQCLEVGEAIVLAQEYVSWHANENDARTLSRIDAVLGQVRTAAYATAAVEEFQTLLIALLDKTKNNKPLFDLLLRHLDLLLQNRGLLGTQLVRA